MSFVGAPPSFRLVLPSDCRQTPGTNSPASQGIHTSFFFHRDQRLHDIQHAGHLTSRQKPD